MRVQARLAHRKGLLQGPINIVQEEALYWIMLDEIDQAVLLERERMKYTILAGNPQLWQQLFANEDEEVDEENVEWIKPESAEDFEQVIALLERGEGQEVFAQSSPSKSP